MKNGENLWENREKFINKKINLKNELKKHEINVENIVGVYEIYSCKTEKRDLKKIKINCNNRNYKN